MQRTWSIHLTTEERHWVWGAIGRQLAMRLDGDALNAYEQARSDHDLTDDMLAWKVRAALRVGNTPAWRAVESAILAMDLPQRQEPVWVYWLGRALQARGHKDQAHTLWEGIASVKGFYEQLALEELGRRIQMPARPAPPTPDEITQARTNPSLQRAVKAIAMGLRTEGVRGLWTGLGPAVARNSIINAAELATYDEVKQRLRRGPRPLSSRGHRGRYR
jgi:soluble lytic murein transglycosylase